MTLHRHDIGLSWTTDDIMQRASHALVDDGRVWLIDPVDDASALAAAAELGRPAAVLQLLDRHGRDCEAIAARLGVPHRRVPEELGDAPFEVHGVIDNRLWREVALWWPARRVLVVPEALGTSRAFTAGRPVGVHPALRLRPPRGLGRFAADHLLVGHGPPRHGPETAGDIRQALARARTDLPRVVATLPSLLRQRRA